MKNFETQVSWLIFPKTQWSRIQMMPFLLTDEKTWTGDIKRYADIIAECINGFKIDGKLESDFKVNPCFITIDERDVKAWETQRKPWVHTEWGYKIFDESIFWGSGGWRFVVPDKGRGIWEYTNTREKVRYGGLFLGSNVNNSTALWDMNVENPWELWDCSDLDLKLKDAYLAQAGELVWLHDRTPHAALPVVQDIHRQFIRIVWPHVSHYFAGDNTANPNMDIRDYYTNIQEDTSMQAFQWFPNHFTFYPGTKQEFLTSQKDIARKHKIGKIQWEIYGYWNSVINELIKHIDKIKILCEDTELSQLLQEREKIDRTKDKYWIQEVSIREKIVSHLLSKKSVLEQYVSLKNLLEILETIEKLQVRILELEEGK